MRNGQFFSQQPSQTQGPAVVEQLLPQNRLAIWAASPGEGKSLVAAALLYSVAYGAPFLGFKVTPGNVIFIDSENRWDVLKQRCEKIRRGLEMDGYSKVGEIEFQHHSGFLLDQKSTWQVIEREVRSLGPSIILLDHLAVFHGQDENKAAPMNHIANRLEELMGLGGSSLLALHHFNKSEGLFAKKAPGQHCHLRTVRCCLRGANAIEEHRWQTGEGRTHLPAQEGPHAPTHPHQDRRGKRLAPVAQRRHVSAYCRSSKGPHLPRYLPHVYSHAGQQDG